MAADNLFPVDRVEHVAFAPTQAREADIERLLEHWSSLRQGASLPRKEALDPAAFGPILPNVTILEQLAPDNYRTRWIHISSAIVRFSRNASAGVR